MESEKSTGVHLLWREAKPGQACQECHEGRASHVLTWPHGRKPEEVLCNGCALKIAETYCLAGTPSAIEPRDER